MLLAYVAVAAAMVSALVGVSADRLPLISKVASFSLLAVSGAAALGAGVSALSGIPAQTGRVAMGLPWLAWHLRLDALSGFFLSIIGLGVLAVAAYGPGYIREFAHGPRPLAVLAVFTGLFVASMELVVLAADAFSFMVAWEVMSLSSYFLVTFQHQQAPNRRAGFLYLLMAEVGALAILLAFGILAGRHGDFTFVAMRHAALSPFWADIACTLAVLGFGMKAGLIPLHPWLPEAHPVAPSHISALMSGVMLKVAIYGLVRVVFDLLAPVHWQWGVVLLVVGSASALFGILSAMMQSDLKRLLAYSSVENVGIIVMALGLSLVFQGRGHPVLAALSLTAGLYHALNHSLFKGLLFLGSGAILQRSHERDLDRMGGLIRRMPYTAGLFLIGCLSISALPPFNGFASEWLLFQSTLQAPALANGVLRTLIPLTAAMLALTGALAAACFVKVYGIGFLGQPRCRHVAHAREVDPGMLGGMGFLAVACVLLGIFPNFVTGMLGRVTLLLTQADLSGSVHGWLWLTPVSAATASYGAPLVMVAILVAWALSFFLLHPGKQVHPVRKAEPWDCGFGALNARTQYTAQAFSQPLRRVFGVVFEVDERMEETRPPDAPLLGPRHLRHQLQIEDRFWRWFYTPIARAVQRGARLVGRMQAGRIRVYLAYSFFTLIFLLWWIT